MSNPNLVVVRAGDNSLHPLWLATGGERNWDLVVNYGGDKALRYPNSGDAMVRIDSKGPRWHALHSLLCDTSDAWRSYEYVWLPDDDLAVCCDEINRMFDLMGALDLHLAQPSFSWDSHVDLAATLHNPNFSLRYASFVDPTAAVLSQSMLRRVTPTLRESLHGSALGYVWPSLLDNPARQCAILDRVQVRRAGRQGNPNRESMPHGSVGPAREMEQLLKKHGIAAPIQAVYGGMDLNGKLATLFDDQGDRFIYKLCEGYLGCAAISPGLLGQMFAEQTRIRQEYLGGAVAPAPAARKATGRGGVLPAVSRAPAQITVVPPVQASQPARTMPTDHELVFKL
jgi:hypothetical protein